MSSEDWVARAKIIMLKEKLSITQRSGASLFAPMRVSLISAWGTLRQRCQYIEQMQSQLIYQFMAKHENLAASQMLRYALVRIMIS